MESLLGMCTPQKAGVPDDDADAIMKRMLATCKDAGVDQEQALAFIGQACRIVQEARGTHKKIACGAFCPAKPDGLLEAMVDILLERTTFLLVKVTRAGAPWLVDPDTADETWEKFI